MALRNLLADIGDFGDALRELGQEREELRKAHAEVIELHRNLTSEQNLQSGLLETVTLLLQSTAKTEKTMQAVLDLLHHQATNPATPPRMKQLSDGLTKTPGKKSKKSNRSKVEVLLMHHPCIRPTPAYLASLPSLRVVTQDSPQGGMLAYFQDFCLDYELSLKVEMPGCRYWICSRHAAAEDPSGLRLGLVVMENMIGKYLEIYSEENAEWARRHDYLAILRRDLVASFRMPASEERTKEIEELSDEISRVQTQRQRTPTEIF